MDQHQRRTTTAEAPGIASDAPSIVDVVLLTRDEKLLATLRQAASAHHALWHAESADGAVELLVGGHGGILVVDLALLRGDVLNLLERLQGQFPELIILATGRRDEEVAVAAAISSGCIYRFLHKPISPARASLFLGTATRRYGELREVPALALATARLVTSRPRFGKTGKAVAALTVLGAACLGWVMDRRPGPANGATPTGVEDNVLALHRAALAQVPVAAMPPARVRRPLRTATFRPPPPAMIVVEPAPQPPTLPAMDSSPVPARAIAPTPTLAKTVEQAIPAVATPQIDRARARMAASQLIAPVDDSAATYLRHARALGEDETRLKIIATDLGARLLEQVRESIAAGDLERAHSDYTSAVALDTEFELGLPELDGIGQQLKAAQLSAAEEQAQRAALPTN